MKTLFGVQFSLTTYTHNKHTQTLRFLFYLPLYFTILFPIIHVIFVLGDVRIKKLTNQEWIINKFNKSLFCKP